MLHGTSKSSLLHGTSKTRCYTTPLKVPCYTTPLNPVATWHPQSPLLHDILTKPIATRQYFYKILQSPNAILAPILQSPILFWQLFIKPKYYFGIYLTKPKYYFDTYFTKPNIILAIIHKAQILFWNLFYKAQYYFGTYFTKSKYYYIMFKAQNYFLAKTYFHILKSLTHGKYKLLISQNISFTKFMGTMLIFSHNQLAAKAHVYHPWQNYSFCKDGQAQRSSTTRPSWVSPAHMQISASKTHVSCQVKVQHNLTWDPLPSVPICEIRSEEDTCPAGVKPFLAKFIFVISHMT